MRYAIDETLEEVTRQMPEGRQYVAVLTPEEWSSEGAAFDMGIDLEVDLTTAFDMQAEVNYDSITGVIRVADLTDFDTPGEKFAFALDEKGIVFIDEGDTAQRLVNEVRTTQRWRNPSLERFLYDFLLLLIAKVPGFIWVYERELDRMEKAIYADEPEAAEPERVNEIRNDLRDLDDYLEHLQDFAGVFEENENGFFKHENLRYFRLFFNRVEKLRDKAQSLREQALQMRDLYKMHLDIHQNRIMSVLTIVTAIFAPLTLIVGWYGMNFQHMPELAWTWSYPALFVIFVAITIGLVAFFKHIKWL